MRQLGSACVAVVILLASAALSERLIPAVESQEPARMPMVAADTVPVLPPEVAAAEDWPPPRVPEQLVMLIAGVVLIGLGGALRTQRHDR